MAEEQKKGPLALREPGFAFVPETWEQLYNFAKEIAQTGFVPTDMQNKPGAVLAAWQKGKEVGLPPMASLQYICIINGRPSIHSDGYWMLITAHPLCEWAKELSSEEALKAGYGECSIKRQGWPEPVTRRFTVEMAQKADLWGDKKDNWKKYPGRMLQWRARHLAGSDALPEASGGLLPVDVAYDYETTATEVKEEPLKIPRSTDVPPPQPLGANKGESQVEDAGQPVGGTRPDPVPERAPFEPPAPEEKPGAKSIAEEEISDWIETAPAEEILTNKNIFTTNLGRVPRDKQLDLAKKFNARRKDALAAKKEAEKSA